MEKAKKSLELTHDESEAASRLTVTPHQAGAGPSFYEYYALRGIRVDRVEPGLVVCSFKVPPRLTDRSGRLANGAIANLVDEVGGAVVHVEGLPMNVSVDMSISFMSTPKLDDRAGNLANGAIATLVDTVGASTVFVPHIPMNVSVDMSISYMAKAKLNDELEITSKRLGQRGRYSGTYVLVRNKASGEIIAEGRHSLFRSSSSKL
ncbi:hypothetical protein C1H46_013479 [Malus baccata]|uniref:Thioesterase domain-containing protein n=1 Tax=Malus baccata TaxID=106549 RepID=A0A540MQ71_MALBA|nr:hypothetical protein C1H46_013479 [Malus baccata]